MMLVTVSAFAQVRVTGVVKDQAGEPIIGAAVMELGTTNGQLTDLDGNFTITVSNSSAVLQISYVGFVTQEIPVGTRTTLNITLEEDRELLEEVVVVGYGQQKKESVIGAISQVSNKDLLATPAANVSQAIAGKIPGLITTQLSGAPGADDTEINIRGRATFTGESSPLILVDGIERSFSQIAPDDIESISVLKDASATAVYGVRGANGVILITTKRGQLQTPQVSLTASAQLQTPTRKNTILNSYDSVVLLEEALANDGLPSQYSANDIAMYKKSVDGQLSGIDALLYPNTDWYNELLTNRAFSQRYTLGIRGGTERMRYYTSGEVYNQGGMIKNLSNDKYGNPSSTDYNRYAFRANMDFSLTSTLTLSINFGTRFEIRTGAASNESQLFQAINHYPGWLFPVTYEVDLGEGNTKKLYAGSSQYQNNPVAALAEGGYYRSTTTVNETNFTLNSNLDWITKGLSAKATLSFDYTDMYQKRYTKSYATYELNDRANYKYQSAYNQFNLDGVYSMGSSHNQNMKVYIEAQVNYARQFGKHNLTAMMLYNQNDQKVMSQLRRRYQGLVGRVTYDYDNRYLAEFNAGYNGSENFQKGMRFGFFPSFSIGWRPTSEEFMKGTSNWLSNLKLRASFGQVGNDRYGQRFLYQAIWTQTSGTYQFGTANKNGIYEQMFPNSEVTWERANKFNAGVEFSLFQGKLTGSADYFYESRNNILTEYLTKPNWVGVTIAAGNLGKTKNAGYEFELMYNNRIGQDFYYYGRFTFSHARNEVIFKDEPQWMTPYRKEEGHQIGQYFGLVSEGFITQKDLDSGSLPVSRFTDQVKVGDLKYKDMNGDGFIDENDVTAIGYSSVPENTYALTLGGSWKNWSFSAMFQAVNHVSRFYDAEAMFAFVDGGKVKEHHLDRWNPAKSEAENLANAKYPLLHYDQYGNHNQRLNSFFLKDGSFLRLKNVEVSYTIPSAISKKMGLSSCRVYVNGSNLITWDKLGGHFVDPESNGSNRYPLMSTFNAGVNINF